LIQIEKKFNNTSWKFQLCDLSLCHLPLGYDLILVRDTLQHLSYSNIFTFLRNVKDNDAKYLMAGSNINTHENNNIDNGARFDLNLLHTPFELPLPLESYSEGLFERGGKYLLLWDLDQLRRWTPISWV